MIKKQQKSVIMENRQKKIWYLWALGFIYAFSCFKTIMLTKNSAINISCDISQPSYDVNFSVNV